jgi:hypothetical protein
VSPTSSRWPNGNGDHLVGGERRRQALRSLMADPTAWAYRQTSGTAEPIFKSSDERRLLLLRLGTGSNAWVYLDTLARAARMAPEALATKLDALERERLVVLQRAPAGPRYRLTDRGRHVRAG